MTTTNENPDITEHYTVFDLGASSGLHRKQDIHAASPFKRWLLEGYLRDAKALHVPMETHKTHPWWAVVCLTGVDYFSTLGYQPGIAALAAGALSPFATLVLVLLTLFGALPMYKRVAEQSPHGDGSISMLENLLPWWQGKLFVLALIGFAATGFIITITLSAADATAHLIENPYLAPYLDHGAWPVVVTLILIGLLAAVFLKGFKEAVNIAVALVLLYLLFNAIVIGRGLIEISHHASLLSDWQTRLFTAPGGGGQVSVPSLILGSLLVFPRLALGLSGFETGVVVMPLVKGDSGDTEERPAGRIQNTKKLLTAAALLMSVYLLTSSVVTTLLIPPAAFQTGGAANGRALAYLSHEFFHPALATLYDISTILILWFAGASAMAGLLNIVPRYLPRYGMAPEWTRAVRPLVLVFTAICFMVTLAFKAGVEEQAGAYATGVLALMTSATIAVTLAARRAGQRAATVWFSLVAVIFVYTTAVNIWEKPDGLRIATLFIAVIVAISIASRVYRTLELRVSQIELDETALRFIREAAAHSEQAGGILRIIPNHPDTRDEHEYRTEGAQVRVDHQMPEDAPLLFFEVYVRDASEFTDRMRICGTEVEGYRVLRADAVAIPNAIAAFLIFLRDETGLRPHAYFSWTEGNPAKYLLRYLFSGRGDVAPVTREILRQVEPDLQKRPAIHAAV